MNERASKKSARSLVAMGAPVSAGIIQSIRWGRAQVGFSVSCEVLSSRRRTQGGDRVKFTEEEVRGEKRRAVAQETALEGLLAQEARVMSRCVALRILHGKDQKAAEKQEAAK